MDYINKSPLQQYCEEVDLKYFDKPYGWFYYVLALKKVPSQWITNKLLEDFDWRASHQQNIISSTEGTQSAGKSLFNINLGIWLGQKFHNPFIIERDIYSNPYDLDFDLRAGKDRRRTFLYDEQPARMVGMGSGSTKISLQDYEDICRYTQNNILYCSPEIVEHSHYFVFQQVDYDINRIENKECKTCKKYPQCTALFYKTLCKIPFHERDGYPKEFRFMLYTKRLSDKVLIPRGIVSFPMVAPQTALAYDKIKGKNINKFEDYENSMWEKKVKDVESFVEEYYMEITKKLKKKRVPESLAIIEGNFYKKFTSTKFTKDEVRILVSMAKKMVTDKCSKK